MTPLTIVPKKWFLEIQHKMWNMDTNWWEKSLLSPPTRIICTHLNDTMSIVSTLYPPTPYPQCGSPLLSYCIHTISTPYPHWGSPLLLSLLIPSRGDFPLSATSSPHTHNAHPPRLINTEKNAAFAKIYGRQRNVTRIVDQMITKLLLDEIRFIMRVCWRSRQSGHPGNIFSVFFIHILFINSFIFNIFAKVEYCI